MNHQRSSSCTPLRIIRSSIQTASILLSVTGMILVGIAVLTPEWSTVWMHELSQFHQHGLWQDCVADNAATGVVYHEFVCAYKHWMPEASTHTQAQEHLGRDWHLATLISCSLAVALSLIAVLFSICSCCNRCCAITWAALNAIAALSSTVGIIVYTKNMHDPANLLIRQATETATQQLGQSFYLGAWGTGALWLAALFSIVACILIIMAWGDRPTTVFAGKRFVSVPMQPMNGKSEGYHQSQTLV